MATPQQREFLESGVLARLSRLELLARGPMEGSVAGRHQSPHRGSSVEFAEYRKYVYGDDPRSSVLDRDCKVHGLDNLYVADSSFMPTSNGVNPSLTIAANALRVGDHIVAGMRPRLAAGAGLGY